MSRPKNHLAAPTNLAIGILPRVARRLRPRCDAHHKKALSKVRNRRPLHARKFDNRIGIDKSQARSARAGIRAPAEKVARRRVQKALPPFTIRTSRSMTITTTRRIRRPRWRGWRPCCGLSWNESGGAPADQRRSPSCHQRGGNTSMDNRSLIVLVAALLLFLAIVVFIVALGDYLFQPIPVQ